MSAFFERRETGDQIEFEFHYTPVASMIFFLAIGASLAPRGRATHKLIRLCGILLIIWVIGLYRAWVELEKAMRKGAVSVSGSKLSFAHPLKVVISKT